MKGYHSNGKILLTGEYAVLDGAMSLALPTKKGQSLNVTPGETGVISWKSIDEQSKIWFENSFKIENGIFLPLISAKKEESEFYKTTLRLQQILQKAYEVKPELFRGNSGYAISSRLEFNRNWGLGSSSSLISNIANWLEIDPYELLEQTFGGSGYDIAAARHNNPITYQLTVSGPSVLAVNFNPVFKEQLFFVYLNKKQNSRQAIAHYKTQPKQGLNILIEKISGITEQIISTNSLSEFELLLEIHENLISQAINLPKIKTSLFSDYPHAIKSLGGWGGDFILAVGNQNDKAYFRQRGYSSIIDYSNLILQTK